MKFYLLVIMCLLSNVMIGQVILDPEKDHFVFRVHSIDDFIERFNGQPNTRANALFEKMLDPSYRKDRQTWLKSLFDQQNGDWDFALIESFISDVLAAQDTKSLRFEDPNWFAVVECSALYRNSLKKLTILLEVEYDESNQGSRWVISHFFPINFFSETRPAPFPMPKNSTIINPMSHATDFIALIQAFDDKKNLGNYFHDLNSDKQLSTFAWELYDGNLKLKSIDNIEFYFFQIPGWFFRVSDFPRNQMNAGWLISFLGKLEDQEMLKVIEEQLNAQRK